MISGSFCAALRCSRSKIGAGDQTFVGNLSRRVAEFESIISPVGADTADRTNKKRVKIPLECMVKGT